MRQDLDEIRKLIKGRYKHFGKEISDDKIDTLANKYSESSLNLLNIMTEIDEKIASEHDPIFDSEEIGDHLAFLQLKQMEIDSAEKSLKQIAKKYKLKGSESAELSNKAFNRENKIRFHSEEIGNHLAYLQLKQLDINSAEKTLNEFIKNTKK